MRQTRSGRDTHRLTALIVDDNDINRLLVKELCKGLNIGSEILEDGDQMIARVAAQLRNHPVYPPYDVLILDINMPGKNGIETLQHIRALGGWAAVIPAIALTAHALQGDEARLYQSGFSGYVSKPIDRETMYAEIERLSRRAKMERKATPTLTR